MIQVSHQLEPPQSIPVTALVALASFAFNHQVGKASTSPHAHVMSA